MTWNASSPTLRPTIPSPPNGWAISCLTRRLSLHTFPERGRIVPEFRRPELREIIFRSFRIIYRMNNADQSVEIVRFWHAARGFPRIPGTI